jgi:cytochrome c oxidase subunit 2
MFNYLIYFCDAPQPWQTGFQDPATPIVEGMQGFHNELVLFCVFISIFICYMLYLVIYLFDEQKNSVPQIFTHSSLLEIVWTIIPALILLILAVPSFSLLYSLDELATPKLTLKIIGHQWYWSYEYSDYSAIAGESLAFDSYMLTDSDLTFGSFRLLEVDNRVILPTSVHIRLLITSADVLHSWAVPSFGIKVDACPGRLSQAFVFLKRDGVYYGQCSEICGVNHGFMPIVVKAVSKTVFIGWLFKKLNYE